jgi:hypothetical protein
MRKSVIRRFTGSTRGSTSYDKRRLVAANSM